MAVEPTATSGNIAFFNDWPQTLSVQAQNANMWKGYEFPSLTIEPSSMGPTEKRIVWSDGSLISGQSWFRLDFKGSWLKINIGSLQYETKLAGYAGPGGEFSCILAPRWGAVADYSFFFVSGHAKLRGILESALEANIDCVLSAIGQNPWIVDLGFDSSLTLKSLKIPKRRVQYAAIAKTKEEVPTWRANVVMTFSGTIDYSLKLVGKEVLGKDVPIEDFWVFLQFSLKLDEHFKPTITLEKIQVSVAVAKLGTPLPTCHQIGGFINDKYNDYVRKAVNDALKGYFKQAASFQSDQSKTTEQIEELLTRSEPSDVVRPREASAWGSDHATWMSTPTVQNKKLSQLKLPGTHDSAAYEFELVLSEVDGPDIKFLWDLRSENAPRNHNPHNKPYFLGNAAYQYVMEEVYRVAQAHHSSKSIKQQLNDGIRSLDIRIYYDHAKKDFYTAHTLRGPSLITVLQDISSYIKEHPSAAELIFVELSHPNFNDQERANQLADLVRKTIGEAHICLPASPGENKNFNFQTLKDKLLSQLTGGTTKAIFVNPESYVCPHSILNVAAETFWRSPTGLASHWFTKEPGLEEILGNILADATDPDHPRLLLQDMARDANGKVGSILKAQPEVSRFVMDWYSEPVGYNAVGVVVGANFNA